MPNNVVSLRQGLADYTGQQLKLIKDTVAKDCNDEEFNLFVTVARNTGLDPFRRQIMAIVFSKKDPEKRRMSIIAGIDGLRTIAARSRRYRPDENEPVYVVDEALKDPDTNPVGLEKATVRIFIRDDGGDAWRPVTGVAYWAEFAPIKDDAEGGYRWEETGEHWPDSGKPKMRKVPVGEVRPMLDTSGQWGKMPRVMLAKCAEAQALRKAFPEDLSGLYEYAELDRARAADELLPSDIIAGYRADNRLARIGGRDAILFQFSPTSPLEHIPLGKVADRIIEAIGEYDLNQFRWFESVNIQPIREFWAKAPTDALEVKKRMEARAAALLKAAQEQAAEEGATDEQAESE